MPLTMIIGATVLAGLLGAELGGYIYHLRAYNFAKKKRYYETDVDADFIENLMLEDMNVEELTTWISNSISYNCSDDHKYYNEVPLDKVPRDKMIKWTCYYLFFKSMWQLSEEQIDRGKALLNRLEERIGIQFPDIDDPNVYFLKFGNNKIECKYRPLVAYGILNVIKHYTYANMRMNGFTVHKMDKSEMKYFYYNNPNSDNTVMFIHGLGLGITPYLSYLKELQELGNVIAPILPNLSNMENHGILEKIDEDAFFPSYETIRHDFKEVLNFHGVEKVSIVSHSFGTIVLGALLKDDELMERIDKKVFVDPVCFIDRSFKIFRYINEPGNSQDGVVNGVFNLLVYNDIYVRYIAQRFLYGPEFWILDYDKLNNDKSMIVLSTKDSMVPSKSIYERCRKNRIPCMMVNDAFHADIFLLDEFKGVWDMIKNYLIYNA